MKNINILTAIAFAGLASSASAVVQCTEFGSEARTACWARKAVLHSVITKPTFASINGSIVATPTTTTTTPTYLNGSTGCTTSNSHGSYNFGDNSTQTISTELSYNVWSDGRTQDDALFIYFGETADNSIALSGAINGVTGMIDFSIENEVAGGGATSISLGSLAIGDSLNMTALTVNSSITQNASGSFDLTYGITDSTGAMVLSGTESNLSNSTLATSDSIRLGHTHTRGSDTYSDDTEYEAGASFLGGTRLADGSYNEAKICADCAPEPSSALLLALAGIGAITRRRR